MRQLEPDDFEMRAAATTLLAACPFCGRHPISITEQNEQTGYYVAKIICADCTLSMSSCSSSREEARANVLARWGNRK